MIIQEKYRPILTSIDKSLEFSRKSLRGLIHTVYTVPDYMVDNSMTAPAPDWCHWKPIKVDIESLEIKKYETLVQVKLPDSYIAFLSYKYFIELNFGHDVEFFMHTKDWINHNVDLIKRWGNDTTIEKGLLPFAKMSDWGLVCFDTKEKHLDNEYNIIYIDHEDKYTPQYFKAGRYSFLTLIDEMTKTLEDWMSELGNGS